MVQINMQEREISLKVVYYGPALSGKTTNLQQIHSLIEAGTRGEMLTLDTADDRTLYFDFLPVHFDIHNGFSVKIKLFTVPGQVMHKSTRKVVLSGADAVVFVVDSQASSTTANSYSWRDMESNLTANSIDADAIPKVIQLNKRDLPEAQPLEEYEAIWPGIQRIPAVANTGEGVIETFRASLHGLYGSLNDEHRFGERFGLDEAQFVKSVLREFPRSNR
ncbi:hypothetical protein MK489_09400 [Myxococcota bacterium]|nr:hypothetical protein [Myxococcota bacterium]